MIIILIIITVICVCMSLCGHVTTSTGVHGAMKKGLENCELGSQLAVSILTRVLSTELGSSARCVPLQPHGTKFPYRLLYSNSLCEQRQSQETSRSMEAVLHLDSETAEVCRKLH